MEKLREKNQKKKKNTKFSNFANISYFIIDNGFNLVSGVPTVKTVSKNFFKNYNKNLV